MPIASDSQVQAYVDNRVRVRCEQIRALYLAVKDDKAAIDDTYSALTQSSPTWTDQRTDSPPHLLTPSDVLSWNAFITSLISAIEASSDYTTVVKGCVRGV